MNQLIRKVLLIGFLFLLPALQINAQVLPLRDQARVIDEILDERLNQLLPQLMEKTGIDMWVMITREYNEDPIVRTFLPATWISARRTTMLVFYYNPATKEYTKSAVARYNVGSSIKAAWDMTKYPDQYDALMAIIQKHQPKKIGINTSVSYGHADGLDHTAYEQFMQKIPAKFKSSVVSAEPLAVAWLETRTEREMQMYPQVVQISKAIIAEGFSSKVITPGITTSEDLVWWYRQKINQLGLSTWFHPSVEIQRNDATAFDHLTAFSNKGHDAKNIIQQGDLLHVDFGITYLRLNSDIQEHAYVLKPGEKDAPEYLKNALAVGNRLQDILTNQFALNKMGNAILKDALAQAKKEGINATIYTHPIGSHGHAAGPTIGMWDMQNGVPGSGDYPMYYQTAYSIELNAAVEIKEWKKTIRIMLEQDGYFDQNGFRYISGRQTKLHLVGNADWQ